MYFLKHIFILCFLFLAIANSGQTQTQKNPLKGGEPLRYEADSLIGYEIESGPARDLITNVRLTHGNVLITSNFATQFLNENRAVARGNVVVTQKGMRLRTQVLRYSGNTNRAVAPEKLILNDINTTLVADSGSYNTNTEIADFKGNVIIEDDSANIYADRIIYDRNTKISHAYGNVLFEGKFTNVLLNGDTVVHTPRKHYAIVTGHPLLFQIDTLQTIDTAFYDEEDFVVQYKYDTMSVSADTMEAFRYPGSEYYVFTGNVEIIKGTTLASAKKAYFYKDQEVIKLYESPVVWFDSTQLHADSIIINIPGNRLTDIFAYDNALAASRDDTLELEKINQLAGKRIEILFDNDTLQSINSYGGSLSLFFFESEDEGDIMQRSLAEDINLIFKDGELFDFVLLKDVDGSYYPANMIPIDIKEFYLPSFRWNDVKPEMREMRRKIIASGKETEKVKNLDRINDIEQEFIEGEIKNEDNIEGDL